MLLPVARLFRRTGAKAVFVLIVGALTLFVLSVSIPDRLSHYVAPKHNSGLSYGENGLAHNFISGQAVHPIEELMARGRAKWEDLISR